MGRWKVWQQTQCKQVRPCFILPPRKVLTRPPLLSSLFIPRELTNRLLLQVGWKGDIARVIIQGGKLLYTHAYTYNILKECVCVVGSLCPSVCCC